MFYGVEIYIFHFNRKPNKCRARNCLIIEWEWIEWNIEYDVGEWNTWVSPLAIRHLFYTFIWFFVCVSFGKAQVNDFQPQAMHDTYSGDKMNWKIFSKIKRKVKQSKKTFQIDSAGKHGSGLREPILNIHNAHCT